jgi:hypothetical protein
MLSTAAASMAMTPVASETKSGFMRRRNVFRTPLLSPSANRTEFIRTAQQHLGRTLIRPRGGKRRCDPGRIKFPVALNSQLNRKRTAGYLRCLDHVGTPIPGPVVSSPRCCRVRSRVFCRGGNSSADFQGPLGSALNFLASRRQGGSRRPRPGHTGGGSSSPLTSSQILFPFPALASSRFSGLMKS